MCSRGEYDAGADTVRSGDGRTGWGTLHVGCVQYGGKSVHSYMVMYLSRMHERSRTRETSHSAAFSCHARFRRLVFSGAAAGLLL